MADAGEGILRAVREAYPTLSSIRYCEDTLDLDVVLDHADLVLVHEWNSLSLVESIGKHRAKGGKYWLLFHDTHHRSVTDPAAMEQLRLEHYDGVLAFGESVAEQYRRRGWGRRVWVWHEAADLRVFGPRPEEPRDCDLVWVGNWGDDERTDELREFLMNPVYRLGLKAHVYGVRYPDTAIEQLRNAGIEYKGYLPNFRTPVAFARAAVTVHVPRRPYAEALHGVPTIRMFEALACGIPLVSAPWDDCEHLFTPGEDYLVARDGAEMEKHVSNVLNDRELADALTSAGRTTILRRHTCAHRVQELLGVIRELQREPEKKMQLSA
jgi:spore maturation protein CgeB